MFSEFTWPDFLWFTSLVAIIYYLCIGGLNYRKEIYHFLFSKKDLLRDTIRAPVKEMPDPVPKVHELITELGLVIRKASEDKPPMSELLFALQRTIKDFSILETTEFKGKINLFIAEELEIYAIYGIGIEDIENLWKK